MLLCKLEESGEISVNSVRIFKDDISAFYDRCLAYISLWEKNFEDVESHKWITRGEVIWSVVEKTAECINILYGKVVNDVDSLFDEVVLAKHYMSDFAKKKNWEETQATSEVKWVEMFRNLMKRICRLLNSSMSRSWYFHYPAPQPLWRESSLS